MIRILIEYSRRWWWAWLGAGLFTILLHLDPDTHHGGAFILMIVGLIVFRINHRWGVARVERTLAVRASHLAAAWWFEGVALGPLLYVLFFTPVFLVFIALGTPPYLFVDVLWTAIVAMGFAGWLLHLTVYVPWRTSINQPEGLREWCASIAFGLSLGASPMLFRRAGAFSFSATNGNDQGAIGTAIMLTAVVLATSSWWATWRLANNFRRERYRAPSRRWLRGPTSTDIRIASFRGFSIPWIIELRNTSVLMGIVAAMPMVTLLTIEPVIARGVPFNLITAAMLFVTVVLSLSRIAEWGMAIRGLRSLPWSRMNIVCYLLSFPALVSLVTGAIVLVIAAIYAPWQFSLWSLLPVFPKILAFAALFCALCMRFGINAAVIVCIFLLQAVMMFLRPLRPDFFSPTPWSVAHSFLAGVIFLSAGFAVIYFLLGSSITYRRAEGAVDRPGA